MQPLPLSLLQPQLQLASSQQQHLVINKLYEISDPIYLLIYTLVISNAKYLIVTTTTTIASTTTTTSTATAVATTASSNKQTMKMLKCKTYYILYYYRHSLMYDYVYLSS